MAGQIIKRGENTWLARIFMGRDANGRRRYFNKTIRGTKKEAQKWLTSSLRDKDVGTFIEPAAMTVNEYLDKWLDTMKSQLRERSHDWYKQILTLYVQPALGSRRLCDVRPLDIQEMEGDLLKVGLTTRTVRHAHVILNHAFKQAVAWQMLTLNPVAAVKAPSLVRQEMRAFSPEEAVRFLHAAREDEYGVLLAFALQTGLRPEEYIGLCRSELDLEKYQVHVRRTVVPRRGGGWYWSKPKTKKGYRTVSFPQSLGRELAEHLRRQSEQRLRLGQMYENHDLVFPSETGVPLCRAGAPNRHFKKLLKSAGLDTKMRLYDLRHSYVTLSLIAGVDIKTVSEQAGHASVAFTLDNYAHVLSTMKQGASDKLESLLRFGTGTL